jgi:hypothetical protein
MTKQNGIRLFGKLKKKVTKKINTPTYYLTMSIASTLDGLNMFAALRKEGVKIEVSKLR